MLSASSAQHLELQRQSSPRLLHLEAHLPETISESMFRGNMWKLIIVFQVI